MFVLKRLMLAAAALAISACVSSVAKAQPGSGDLPPDVTEFINRRASCSEWSQEAIDAGWNAKAGDIWANLQSLKCFDVAENHNALRQKYAGHTEILASLGSAAWVKVVKRLPVRIAVPPDFGR